ncbi:MAG: head-tail connector protein, partial [Sphingomonadales bacterium]
MSKTRITEPTLEPLTLAEVKQFLRIETADENALLSMWISQAREACETFIGRALITQDWQLVTEAHGGLELRPGPVQSILSVSYDDGDETRILTADEYRLRSRDGLDRILFDPALGRGEVSVDFRTG